MSKLPQPLPVVFSNTYRNKLCQISSNFPFLLHRHTTKITHTHTNTYTNTFAHTNTVTKKQFSKSILGI